MLFKQSIRKEDVNEFVSRHPFSHYMQSVEYASFRSNGAIHYTGLYDNNILVGVATLIEEKNHIGKTIYIPCGMCIDYTNFELVEEYTKHLVLFARKLGANQIIIDPPVLRKERRIDGTEVENGINHEDVTEFLKKIGYQHRGYNYGYDGSHRNRYTLLLDITPSFEDIVKKFPKSKQNQLKRAKRMPITLKEGGKELANDLALFATELANKKQFKSHDKEYFERLIETYGPRGHTYLVSINLKEQKDAIQNEIDSGKYKKDPEAKEHALHDIERIENEINEFGEVVNLCASFFVVNNDTVYNLYTYSSKKLAAYHAADYMHYEVIHRMKDAGIKKYDFVGFSGVVDPSDPYYSLYSYKMKFGPDFVEHIGEFTYVLKPIPATINKFIRKVGTMLKKKV